MKILPIILLFTVSLLARDNFILEYGKSSEIQDKISKLERDVARLKKQIAFIKRVEQTEAKPLKESAEEKALAPAVIAVPVAAPTSMDSEALNSLKISVWNLQKDVKKLQKKSNKKVVSDSSKLIAANKMLATKVARLEKEVKNFRGMKAPVASNHDSMRIDILDEKISGVEREMKMLGENSGSSMQMVAGLNFKDRLTQYFLILVGVVLLLLFAMAAIAMGRSKDALVSVKKLSAIKRK